MGHADLGQVVEQIVRRCQRSGMSRADAEDCVQEAVLALLLQVRADEAPPVEHVQAWLSVTAYRKQLDTLRRAGRERKAITRMGTGVATVPDPGEVTADRAQAEWLVDAIHRLPAATQQVCHAIAAGASVEETAELLGLTRRAVQSHLTRARRFLRHLTAGTVALLAIIGARLLRPVTVVAVPAATVTASVAIALLPHQADLPQYGTSGPPEQARDVGTHQHEGPRSPRSSRTPPRTTEVSPQPPWPTHPPVTSPPPTATAPVDPTAAAPASTHKAVPSPEPSTRSESVADTPTPGPEISNEPGRVLISPPLVPAGDVVDLLPNVHPLPQTAQPDTPASAPNG